MPWKTFLKAHAGAICAVDFFSVKVLTFTGLVRTLVLFAVDLETRRVQICGVARQPCGVWMKQVARNLTDGLREFLLGGADSRQDVRATLSLESLQERYLRSMRARQSTSLEQTGFLEPGIETRPLDITETPSDEIDTVRSVTKRARAQQLGVSTTRVHLASARWPRS